MRISLNGEAAEIGSGETPSSLLERLNFTPEDALVVLNGDILGEGGLDKPLKDGDTVDLLQFAGGG